LQPRSEVGRLANDATLLRFTRSDQVADDYQPCCNADTGLQRRARLQAAHCRNQLQPCAYGSLCVVFVRLRVAEVDECPVAHVLRYKASEALHGVCDALLVG
jgi:hypothetical protein